MRSSEEGATLAGRPLPSVRWFGAPGYTASRMVLMPIPAPMHWVARP